jgi:Raf kinase inhibitor-like YbhB/YbcL family protein
MNIRTVTAVFSLGTVIMLTTSTRSFAKNKGGNTAPRTSLSMQAVQNLDDSAQDRDDDWRDRFEVSSTTFENDKTVPLSMLFNAQVNGVNVCSINGRPGGNKSPELSWTNVPRDTRSFAVIAFDVTAGFTHWGMYNISAETTELPENAGVTGSSYGKQVINNFGSAGTDAFLSYDGPCPPANYPPNVHHYVFTVYALDIELELPSSRNFPPTADTLFRALIEAGRHRHILASASLTGLYSTTKGSD